MTEFNDLRRRFPRGTQVRGLPGWGTVVDASTSQASGAMRSDGPIIEGQADIYVAVRWDRTNDLIGSSYPEDLHIVADLEGAHQRFPVGTRVEFMEPDGRIPQSLRGCVVRASEVYDFAEHLGGGAFINPADPNQIRIAILWDATDNQDRILGNQMLNYLIPEYSTPPESEPRNPFRRSAVIEPHTYPLWGFREGELLRFRDTEPLAGELVRVRTGANRDESCIGVRFVNRAVGGHGGWHPNRFESACPTRYGWRPTL